VGEEFQLCAIHPITCDAKALRTNSTHVVALWTISFALTITYIKRGRSVSDNLRMNKSHGSVDARAIA
jgi:hypothetical protein